MKVSFIILAAAAAVFAQDTVSATGGVCEAHDDHWHCPDGVPEPTTPPAAAATESHEDHAPSVTTGSAAAVETCEPHGDHWHCPDGVPEPATPPEAATTAAPTASESHEEHDHEHEATAASCEPHGDHWHCPSGVAEPTTPPAVSQSAASATPTSNSTTSASPSPSVSQFDGAAAGLTTTSGSFMAVILGAIGAFFL